MPRVYVKPITWYIQMHHVRTFFSVWRHDFFLVHVRDVHSQRVYLQEESLPRFLSAIELPAWPLFMSWRWNMINTRVFLAPPLTCILMTSPCVVWLMVFGQCADLVTTNNLNAFLLFITLQIFKSTELLTD